jgi:hypothetical protein
MGDGAHPWGGCPMTETFRPLYTFQAVEPDDTAKDAMELRCTECGDLLCDIEHGDTLDVLVSVTRDHRCKEGNRL